jgi:tetratricopeptide (TPR) repeat protein
MNDAWLLAWVLCRFGTSLFYEGEHNLAYPLLKESLEIFERLGDPLQVGDHFIMLGSIAYERGDLIEAQGFFQKALASAQAMQSKWTEANALWNLGKLAYDQNEYQLMQAYLQQSVSLQRETGSVFLKGTLVHLSVAEINLGLPGQAALHLKECMQISAGEGWMVEPLLGIARIGLQTDRVIPAVQILGVYKRLGKGGMDQVLQKEFETAWAEAKSLLDELAFDQAISEGQALTLEQAVELARELC